MHIRDYIDNILFILGTYPINLEGKVYIYVDCDGSVFTKAWELTEDEMKCRHCGERATQVVGGTKEEILFECVRELRRELAETEDRLIEFEELMN
jgi:hypothetical protein